LNASREFQLRAYERASEAIHSLIGGDHLGTSSTTDRRRRAEAKLNRTRALLAALGDPQRRFPTVHVTGTSGKGSTAAMLSAILTAAGYRVGLRTSPYLQVPTEKLQIGSTLIDPISFEVLVSEILKTGRQLFPLADLTHRLSYAEVWSAMAMQWFADRAVDIAIVEVGAGGRFDSTNVIDPLVCIVTSVGLDHVISLGPTIADIAWHKAGIIKPGSIAIVGDLPQTALMVVEEEAKHVGAPIRWTRDAQLPMNWTSAMAGKFQHANARAAFAAALVLRAQGFAVSDAAIVSGLSTARLPGRMERMPKGNAPHVWIDGAHNEDKIAALAAEAVSISGNGSRPVIVLGVLGSKDFATIAAGLIPVASAIVTTQPRVIGKRSRDAEELAAAMRQSGFHGPMVIEPEPPTALQRAEEIAGSMGTHVLVAGSMYLAGEVRRRWYPDDEIVLQRTPWPESADEDWSGGF
jgi:dihydrofolate synthase/folylpolyglutamate synthase